MWSSIKASVSDVKKYVTSTKDSIQNGWANFEVICPDCGSVLVPPPYSENQLTFICGNCSTELLIPSYASKLLFFGNVGVDRAGNKIDSALGSKQFLSVETVVPEGVNAGEWMQITYNDNLYKVQVPAAKKSGDIIHVTLDVTGLRQAKKRYIAEKASHAKIVVAAQKSTPPEAVVPEKNDEASSEKKEDHGEKAVSVAGVKSKETAKTNDDVEVTATKFVVESGDDFEPVSLDSKSPLEPTAEERAAEILKKSSLNNI